jgi:hypothetical protein
MGTDQGDQSGLQGSGRERGQQHLERPIDRNRPAGAVKIEIQEFIPNPRQSFASRLAAIAVAKSSYLRKKTAAGSHRFYLW